MNNFVTSYYLYKFYRDPTSKRNLILEPLSTILKLAILTYKESGTKISIHDNAIQYSEPSVMQGLYRGLHGDNREDLHNICNPLKKSLEWYPRTDESYEILYRLCLKGLETLNKAYDTNSTIHHTIQHYIGLLESEPKSGEKVQDKSEKSEEDKPENPLIDELRDIWSREEIAIVSDLLGLCESLESERDIYLKSLIHIVESKERQVYEYIQKSATQY